MRKLIFIIATIILIILFITFGRSIYMPLVHKIKGKETVDSVLQKREGSVLDRIQSNLNIAGFSDFPDKLMMVAFKEERKLQIYGKDNEEIKFIKEYPFTAFSGELGPKLKEGDKQIPEGIYKVEYLNPNSSYYLSIKVNYPNEFDKSKTTLSSIGKMGGDIFIHGKSVTIGCIPIGDEAIEEVFVMTQKAFHNEIEVIISPRDFRVNNEFPKIQSIDWEDELYEIVSEELKKFPIQ